MLIIVFIFVVPFALGVIPQPKLGRAFEGLLKCQTTAPFSNMNYTYENVHNLPNELVCADYAKRTCCSSQNFAKLQTMTSKLYLSQDISTGCSVHLNNLYCYDCDGDVGVGLRKGICPYTCRKIYNQCKKDFFVVRETMKPELFPCQGSSLICSALENITDNHYEFCRMLGFEVNDLKELEADEIEALRVDKSQYKPFCFDLTPSSELWGVASSRTFSEPSSRGSSSDSTFWKSLRKSLSWKLVAAIISLLLIPIVAGLYCCYLERKKKQYYYSLKDD